jgi:tetratricopeptide (TPR) repeat protein
VKTRANEAAGLRLLQESLEAREQLAAKDPNNSGARGEVAEACATLGDTYLQMNRSKLARDYYVRAREMYNELLSQGKLAADFHGEPERLGAALAKLGPKGVS